jgi:hypothetical protein
MLTAHTMLHFFILMRVCGVAAVSMVLPSGTIATVAAAQRADFDEDERKLEQGEWVPSVSVDLDQYIY